MKVIEAYVYEEVNHGKYEIDRKRDGYCIKCEDLRYKGRYLYVSKVNNDNTCELSIDYTYARVFSKSKAEELVKKLK
jgi:hypothetical protein